MTNDELYHHGILGMHWGQRRYQDKNGKLTAAGKKRYGGNPIKKFTTKIKRKRALEKARKTREENRKKAEELKKNKEEWAKDPGSLKAHMDDFTNEELSEAITRLQLQKSIADLKYDKIQRGKKYVDLVGGLAKDVTQVAAMATTVKTAYDTFNGKGGNKKNGQGKDDTPKPDAQKPNTPKPDDSGSTSKLKGGVVGMKWITADENEEAVKAVKTLGDTLADKVLSDFDSRIANYSAAYKDGRMSKGAYDTAAEDIKNKSLKRIDAVNDMLRDNGIDPDQFIMKQKKDK